MKVAKPTRGRPPKGPARREAILDAALRCFVDRGFHATAVPQVAKRAGIAAGTIYHYFPSKDALVNALYRKWKSEIARRVLAAFPQTAAPREQFTVMWREMVEFATEHPAAFAFIELHNHGGYLDAESVALENTLKEFAAGAMVRGQADGVIKSAAPALLMELVFGAFNGMMRALWEGRIELPPEAIAAAEQACWDSIAMHP